MTAPRPSILPWLGATLALCVSAAAAAAAAAAESRDLLAERGFTVTAGAAPGYVEDRVCGLCHPDIWVTYQDVGMAKSFGRPTAVSAIESFDGVFHHEPSGRYYEMRRQDDRLIFRRYQLDGTGQPIHELELEVDWVLGSGNEYRAYLHQTEAGELYELPVAWYADSGDWGMAPGFDSAHHPGAGRRIERDCLFCHNAYPEVTEGSDLAGKPPLFPQELPAGTGCQRCHGPGEAHVRLGLSAEPDMDELRAAVVHPGKLEPARRDDVCYQCHLQPSSLSAGLRVFGRGDYSYRPGAPLEEYLVHLDFDEDGRRHDERFEINHHAYRLRQSACVTESGGPLSCTTCHDPHRTVPAEERVEHYRQACLGCHSSEAVATAHPQADVTDCVSCHMPERRAQDVVQVVLTDHFIRRTPADADLTAPLEERVPTVTGVSFYEPRRAPTGDEGRLYRATAVVRTAPNADPTDLMAALLARPQTIEPYFDLVRSLLGRRRLDAAESIAEALVDRDGGARAIEWRGLVNARRDRTEAAIADLERAVEADPDRPETLANLGLLLLGAERAGEAIEPLERALELRPNFPTALFYLGEAYRVEERVDEAIATWRRALAVEPSLDRAYVALGRALLARGEREEAVRLLQHGVTHARRPQTVEPLLVEALTAGDDG